MLLGLNRRLLIHVRNSLRLSRDGCGDQFLARSVEVLARKSQNGEQAIHCLTVRLQSTVGVNVRDIDALLIQSTGDEERPVAVEWLLLRAHERDSVFGGAMNDTDQSALERFRRRDTIVADTSVFIAGRVFGPATQGVARDTRTGSPPHPGLPQMARG